MRLIVVACIACVGCGGAMTPVAPIEAPAPPATTASTTSASTTTASSAPPSSSASSSAESTASPPSPNIITIKMAETNTHIAGKVDPIMVRKTIRASFPAFRNCYHAALKRDSSAHGVVAPTFVIGLDGSVSDVKIDASLTTLADLPMQACLGTAFGALVFDPPATKVWVRYPIDYSSEH